MDECSPATLNGSVLFHLSVVQSYQNTGHVISSYSVVCGGGQNFFEQLFNTWSYIIILQPWLLKSFTHSFAGFFIGNAVPDSIASQYDKLVPLRSFLPCYVWIGRHSLGFGPKVLLIFVLKVSESSAQGKVSIHPRILDHMVGL